jgi:serine/threonine-protein kinase HipA
MSSRPGEKLNVFLGGTMVGELEARGPSRYRFAYAPSALGGVPDATGTHVLSASLSPRARAFSPAETAPFFEGLLPEGAVRESIARSFRLSAEDGFGLLAAIGAECAGAVAVMPAGASPASPGEGRVHALEEDELIRLIDTLPRNPLGVDSHPGGVRLSLGGIQHKLVLTRLWREDYAQPLDGAASTCLLKPEFGQYDEIVTNEAFCMKVAETVGLRTARVQLVEIGPFKCLDVERFDRVLRGNGQADRLHQEDMCQALGVLPAAKYEENGGPSIAAVVELLRKLRGRDLARDVNDFIHAALVNFLLGNSDAHGKNFALLYESGSRVRLAPMYDIVSTAVYPDVTNRMAMKIGGHDDPDRVDLEAWTALAEECGLGGGMATLVRRRTAAVLRAVEHWRSNAAGDGWHRPVIDAIVDVCRRRAEQLIA